MYRYEITHDAKPIPIYEASIIALVPSGTHSDKEYQPAASCDSQYFHVVKPLREMLPKSNELFLIPNDEFSASSSGAFNCIGIAAKCAAVLVGANLRLVSNEIMLYSPYRWDYLM